MSDDVNVQLRTYRIVVEPTSRTVSVVLSGPQGPAGTGAATNGLPAGGTAGQILAKNSSTNYDSSWATPSTAAIADDAVTNAKLANVSTATFKGRKTAGTGDPEDMTATEATALLEAFSSSLKGLAPPSGGGTTNFLRADGTWAAPAGGSGGGGTTILDGAGAPATGTGAAGNYYEDTTTGVLYGPKASSLFGADQIIAVSGAPNLSITQMEYGAQVLFAKSGRVTGFRYQRRADSAATLKFNIWNDTTHARLGTVNATDAGAGTFTVMLGTPVTVAAGQLYTCSVGAVGGVPMYGSAANAVTNTADVTFQAFRRYNNNDTWPDTVRSETYFVEPIFQADTLPWPVTVRTVPTGHGTAYHYMVHTFVADATANTVLTNMGAAEEFLDATQKFITKVDLAQFTHVRLGTRRMASAAIAGAKMMLQYATVNPSQTFVGSEWTESGAEVGLNVTNTSIDSGWIAMPTGMKIDDCYITIVLSGGDGVIDPVVGGIRATFRGPIIHS